MCIRDRAKGQESNDGRGHQALAGHSPKGQSGERITEHLRSSQIITDKSDQLHGSHGGSQRGIVDTDFLPVDTGEFASDQLQGSHGGSQRGTDVDILPEHVGNSKLDQLQSSHG
eukprot:10318740-Karenia_brevis.AAC.1